MPAQNSRLFGTDGVRGVANTELTPELALSLGRAAGLWLRTDGPVIVGRDTRRSGEMLSGALQSGFHSAGIDTIDVGVMPSGGISHLTADSAAVMGAVVSASHNPAADNGIKFLGPGGVKLADAEEKGIEDRLESTSRRVPFGAEVGTRFVDGSGSTRYVRHLAHGAEYTLNGISIVLDCANGAAYQTAPALFELLGADVTALCAEPTGMNINEGCGATHPETLAAAVNGRIGLAFDGDADRLIAVDEDGKIVDGDRIMAIVARSWKEKRTLRNDTVVTTVMANLGFRKSMMEAGITVVEAQVGDRYVLEKMRESEANLGGEQSGHIIFADRGKTGDGLLTGIRLLEIVAGTGKSLGELSAAAMTSFPQVLVNVGVVDRNDLEGAESVWSTVNDVQSELGPDGRVLVRASGTEPLVRVMVEAPSQDQAQRYAETIATEVEARLGAATS